MGKTAEGWKKLGAELRGRGSDFNSKLKSIIANGWQGEAADQASTIGEPVAQWMEGTGNAFDLTGNRLKEAASAAGQVKHMVPEPEGHSWGRTAASAVPLGILGGGADALAQMKERREAENQARETMGRVYSPTFTNVDSGIPQFQKPTGEVVEPPPVQPPPPTNWGQGDASGSNVPGGSAGGGGGAAGGVGGAGTGSTAGNFQPGQMPNDIAGRGPEDGAGWEPPAGSDSSWVDPKMPPTGPYGPGGGPPGGPGLPAGGGGGGGGGMVAGMPAGAGAGGAGVGGAGSMGAGGRAGAGAVGGASGAGATGAGAGSGARGGAGGRGGMMGGMGGQRGGQGGGDDEHERPSWLEEHDDIWLNDMPKTAPPVLGE